MSNDGAMVAGQLRFRYKRIRIDVLYICSDQGALVMILFHTYVPLTVSLYAFRKTALPLWPNH